MNISKLFVRKSFPCFLIMHQIYRFHNWANLHCGASYERADLISLKKVGIWRRKWQPTPVFLPGKINGQRSLAG